ncbi:rhomboid protease ROM6 [Plasmodium berghei]|uniref:Rhomboid protease ROM6 n=2 Tax=Plasmodium berghei TaxID=5821 RepID=A0A509AYB6_PLABA|nr:rhomboid protease ROM6 [Plasmodium berghei ANKA]CXJ03877.1 rhomboid protease ROM6 [Plasmodium berghei]SCL98563.1 rhomboid protease ROM6 [Plasmodium berghei]SCM16854.1 rhomboid protease ROM6 [Plasmodium berghei]SCM18652.1 rhomboid protease ROM6 [Plasmodium berghei]SCN28087.1 rhomboid protease ROM6 [Plasmodium berghei]|eukprot:XP_034423737.1 rhomboid protease ROM6 [Plasmodium berghei ANKA]
MFNYYKYFRTNYFKYRFLHINTIKHFHPFTKVVSKIQENAIKKKEKNIKLKERIKLIIFSSFYFFACDYLYHVYKLKGNKKVEEGDAYTPKEKLLTGNTKKYENKYQNNEMIPNFIKWINVFSRPEQTNKYMLQKDGPGISDKNNQRYDNNDDLICEQINNSNVDDESIYEIKINNIKKKKNEQNYKRDEFTVIRNQIFGYNMGNSIGGNTGKDPSQERNFKEIIENNLYRKNLLSGNNLFLIANGVIFLCWRLSDIARNQKFYNFMCRHFICSYENIKKKHYHTIFTASISHMTLPHFLFNMWAFHTITNTLLYPEIKEKKTNYYYFFNYKSNILEKKITNKDIINVCLLSSVMSTIPYILLNRYAQLLGASGAIMGLVYILSVVKPNEIFVSVFPFPYLKLSALQLCHISILTNFIFLFYKKNNFSIAWSAHLFGLLGGAIYSYYQRKINNNYNYYPFIQLSIQNGYLDYTNTYRDLLDFIKTLKLQTISFFSLDHRNIQQITKQLYMIQYKKSQRRAKIHAMKINNLKQMEK